MEFLFHIIGQADWDTARNAGTYAPESLDTEGFIHFSSREQVEATANRYYRELDDLLVLVVDPADLDGEVKWEDLTGGGVEFPHLYAPLPGRAVHHSVPLERAANGDWMLAFAHDGGDVDALAPGYPAARRRFLASAEAADATVASTTHPCRGLDGEDLFVDVATVGDPGGTNVLLVVSATHGVEGYCGSALQAHWLGEHAAERPHDVTVVMVHAFNPFGFSWVRRVNEDNVDLNRNFIDWTAPLPANDAYSEIADLLVPSDWSLGTQERTFVELANLVAERGLDHMQSVVSSGQYAHPTGVFFGGSAPVWSHEWLREWAAVDLAAATDLAVLDLHTGLGAWGNCQLIGHGSARTEGHQRATDWWGPVVPMGGQDSVSAALSGDWLGVVDELVPNARTTAVALEYGTVDAISVLGALRADAWLHGHSDPLGADGPDIRAQVRAAFADDDPAWIRSCWPHFARAMIQALGALGRQR